MKCRVYRLDPNIGIKQYPALQDDCFVLGDPSKGRQKHHSKNKVLVRDEQEMIDLILIGYSIRVKTDTAPALVCRNLYVDGKQVN